MNAYFFWLLSLVTILVLIQLHKHLSERRTMRNIHLRNMIELFQAIKRLSKEEEKGIVWRLGTWWQEDRLKSIANQIDIESRDLYK